jgi:hypothetical protein
VIAAWYSTAGRFSQPRLALRSEAAQVFTAPGSSKDPVPDDRLGELFVVLRDTRGGQSWVRQPLYVCDPALPDPTAVSLEPTTTGPPGTVVKVKGLEMASALDVLLGSHVLTGGKFSSAEDAFVGTVPPAPAGAYPLTIRSKNCGDVATPLVFTVQ